MNQFGQRKSAVRNCFLPRVAQSCGFSYRSRLFYTEKLSFVKRKYLLRGVYSYRSEFLVRGLPHQDVFAE
jgi:hypothetical protein